MTDTTPRLAEAQAAAYLARQGMDKLLLETTDEDAVLAVIPAAGGASEVVDLQDYADRPRASQPREIVFYVAGSLIDYVKDRVSTHARIVHNPDSLTITCIEDDQTWQCKTAKLVLRPTREWADWSANSGKTMGQESFAEFVEDHTPDFAVPTAADMLEIAQTFHATEAAKFTSGVRLSTGETRLTYEQEINATAGKTGQLDVPSMIVLRLRPFEGSDPVDITARFRFRLSKGNIVLGYVLDRPHDVARAAFDTFCATVRAELPDWLHTVGKN